jgi:hypothetical protein
MAQRQQQEGERLRLALNHYPALWLDTFAGEFKEKRTAHIPEIKHAERNSKKAGPSAFCSVPNEKGGHEACLTVFLH